MLNVPLGPDFGTNVKYPLDIHKARRVARFVLQVAHVVQHHMLQMNSTLFLWKRAEKT